MNVFEVREQLVQDYRSFTAAFVELRDERIRAFIAEQLAEGAQWPDPWLSLNPNFEGGGTVTQLADQGLLHAECHRIFRVKEHPALRLDFADFAENPAVKFSAKESAERALRSVVESRLYADLKRGGNTQEIIDSAMAVAGDESVDDLRDEYARRDAHADAARRYLMPVLVAARSFVDEIEFIADRVTDRLGRHSRDRAGDMAICTARTTVSWTR